METLISIVCGYMHASVGIMRVLDFSFRFNDLITNYDTLVAKGKINDIVKTLKTDARRFYKDFDLLVEIGLYDMQTPMYQEYQEQAIEQGHLTQMTIFPSPTKYTSQQLYMKSVFADSTMLFKLLDKLNKKAIKKLN